MGEGSGGGGLWEFSHLQREEEGLFGFSKD